MPTIGRPLTTANAPAHEFDPPPSLTDAIAKHVSAAIIAGRLKPGQRLRETELCRELGVSRSPVREALRVLAAEGLIVLLPRRGAHVAEITPKVIEDVFAVRTLLDAYAARLAAQRVIPDQVAELRRMNAGMREAVRSSDAARFFELNAAFHNAVALLAGNAYLASLQQVAAARTFRTLFMSGSNLAHLDASVAAHEDLLDALADGDAVSAELVMREHLAAGRREALRVVNRLQAGATSEHTSATGSRSKQIPDSEREEE